MSKFIVAGVALIAAGSASHAATNLNFTSASIGQIRSFNFNAFTDDYLGAALPLPGLSARLRLNLTGISGNTWSFAYSVANTSFAPISTSRVSVFGFDVSPRLQSATATGEFSSVGSGNVPLGRSDSDVCFRTGGGGQCAGGGGGGVTIGEAASTGVFKLIFAAPTSSVMLNDLFVRYQSLNSQSLRIREASGVGDVVGGTVPEPTTWAMLIVGFGAVGGALRRQRTVLAA